MNASHGRATAMLILTLTASLAAAGCATANKTRQPGRGSTASRPPAKPVDVRAQQDHYDQGLKYYSREKYDEARKAFQRVVDLGPNTSLGQKAQENLRKIQQIMKTVEEIESK